MEIIRDNGSPFEEVRKNAQRYQKLRHWMSSNVKEGWSEVELLGALAAYMSYSDFDQYLDSLPVCNFGLCEVRS